MKVRVCVCFIDSTVTSIVELSLPLQQTTCTNIVPIISIFTSTDGEARGSIAAFLYILNSPYANPGSPNSSIKLRKVR